MKDKMLPVLFAAIIVLIQIVFAPILTMFGIVPNFIVPFVLVLSIMRASDSTYVYAFVLGLIHDLLAQTPIGLTSLLLLVGSFALVRVFEVLDRSTPVMPLIALAVAGLIYELLFMIVLLITGYSGGFFELLVARVLPCAVFDALISIVLYLIMSRMSFEQDNHDAWRVADRARYR